MDVKLYVDVECITYMSALLWFRNRLKKCTYDAHMTHQIYAHIWNLDTCMQCILDAPDIYTSMSDIELGVDVFAYTV